MSALNSGWTPLSTVFAACFAVAIVSAPNLAGAQKPDVPTVVTVRAPALLQSVRARLLESVRAGTTPSVSVAVAQDGRIIWEEAIGWADLAKHRPAAPNSMYRIGSLSKAIIATAVMTGVEKKIFTLDDPVARLIAPARLTVYEGNGDLLTVKHLLNMTSGIPHGYLGYVQRDDLPQSEAQKDDYVARAPIVVFPPGQVYEYSNFSIGLGDLVLERATRTPFEKYMRTEVLQPLGMQHTAVGPSDDLRGQSVVPYGKMDEPITRASYLLPTGGLGFQSSAHDLIMFGMFHLKAHRTDQKRILSDATIDLMHSYDQGPQGTHFALGWFNVGRRLVSDGQVGGGTSNLTLIPAANVAIVVLTNITSRGQSANAGVFAHDIAQLFDPARPGDRSFTQSDFFRKFNTPYHVTEEISGTWNGVVKAAGGDVPITLHFDAAGVRAQLDGQAAVALEDVTFNELKELRGSFHGRVRSPEKYDSGAVSDLTLTVRLADRRLYGYVGRSFSSEQGSFMLPLYVSLRKEGK